jgi:long-chain acyl-CoA synthetase
MVFVCYPIIQLFSYSVNHYSFVIILLPLPPHFFKIKTMNLPTTYTLQAVLKNSAALFGDQTALRFVNHTAISFRQLAAMALKIGFYLREKGVKQQDKVAILSENMPNWGVTYFAVASAGMVIVPVLADFSTTEVNNILVHSDTKTLFLSKKMATKHGDALKFDGDIIYIEDFSSKETGDTVEAFVDSNAEAFARYEAPEVTENDLASIIYTSGTTGRNKGVMLSHINIVYDAVKILTVQSVDTGDSMLSVLPLAHSYECTLGFVLPVMRGATVYYMEKPPTASHLLPALQKVKPTHILTVPLIIEKIFKTTIKPKLTANFALKLLYKIGFIRQQLHKKAGKQLMEKFGGRLIFFGIGGAPLNPEVEKFLLDSKVIPYAIGYGMTETAPITVAGGVGKTHLQGIGKVMEGVELRIDNPHPKTGEGEIVVRGKMVMLGYYKDPEATREVLSEDGWLRTGDLGVIKKGIVYIKGRSKNMILGASGENIYPEEIEAVINSQDAVSDSLVYQANGKLIALIQFERATLTAAIEDFWQMDMTHRMEYNVTHTQEDKEKAYFQNLKKGINEQFGKYSQIADIETRFEPFEKTATQKIKRYLYC